MTTNSTTIESWSTKLDIAPVTCAHEKVCKRCNTIAKFVQMPPNNNSTIINPTQIDWISEFCGGVLGFRARISGVQHELAELSHVRDVRLDPADLDYHLAALFFAMDSALECLAYALNAIGWACAPSDCKCYMDLHVEKSLKGINIGIYTNAKNSCTNNKCPSFPAMRKCWQADANKKCIDRLTQQHDVTKHRRATMAGHGQRQIAATETSASDQVTRRSHLVSMRNNPPADYILHTNIKALPVEKAQASARGKPCGSPLAELLSEGKVYFLGELIKQYKVLIEETAKCFESDIDALLAKY